MKITFFFNYLNHHQVLVADEMYKLLGEDFRFVATYSRDPRELKGGLDYSNKPYCILAAESDKAAREAHRLNMVSDVCVFGAANLDWEKERSTTNKLSFEVSERWLKRGWRNVLSPRLIKWWWLYQRRLKNKPFYRLCCSAFTASDDLKLGCYKGRHYKWGYFTAVDEYFDVEASIAEASALGIIPIMWCARFLMLKHPELPVEMARRLKEKGYRFILDFYGSGEQEEPTKLLVEKYQLHDFVKFHGNVPNGLVQEAMRRHSIFLFTSDKNEGWGAVANESMANGCVLVASDVIGSSPYLIRDGYNGFKFKSEDVEDLTAKVQWLLDNKEELNKMQQNAYQAMKDLWSPQVAAKNLLTLVDDLQKGNDTSIQKGPGAKA